MNWKKITSPFPEYMDAFEHRLVPLKVMRSISTADSGFWYHLSVSRPDRIPSWDDLLKVRNELLGDIECYHVIPTAKDYVNVHPYCMHIWARFDQQRCVVNLQELEYERAPRPKEMPFAE